MQEIGYADTIMAWVYPNHCTWPKHCTSSQSMLKPHQQVCPGGSVLSVSALGVSCLMRAVATPQ